ncbi:dynein intermediate chain, cytosolic, variant [Blastomyces dermatitidis ER-3]|uniref:Dynein intermediate chain, cytosolic, variant n=3 Tax=Blastomyces TaxID=229219 RepID=A0A179UPE5_BLAGS|nr:dynein intermediate chain, cytosolic, variant [Blastomyces gilchristii SLH14081]XP_045282411.1 dynein intermediate chain, cytosolic, variant [Blastomyces dermatitidis ER-3]EQL36790.1 dynein intermediate chain, cytosolic, variant [Blastomyces dermatitidis ATCC 26199]KMW68408.1 dynein intermediate chain, cytosolic, variant [Blastomyces dermatitidis ATCC 18188]OAT02684.1 dynein intermediate chain, cytosolic, variant [Blastomyces dermatitidis ER-3]OAT08272.1 dynein intermediate chain, cytosolic
MTMQQRKDEILAKKAKLAELRRQRELRQKEFSQNRQSIGEGGSEILAPTPGRSDSRAELNSLISRLVDRPSSAALRDGGESPRGRGSRPNSVLSAGQLSGEILESVTPPARPVSLSIATQTTPFPAAELPTPEAVPLPKPEVVTYSKGVQTDSWIEPRSRSVDGHSVSEDDSSPTTSRANKRLSRRQQRERDEEIRERLRKEIEEEVRSAKGMAGEGTAQQSTDIRYPLRTLTSDELNAVTSSNDFLDFVDKSSRVIERALDEQYDVLTDYALGGVGANGPDENDEYGNSKKRRGIEELVQFYDERWSKKRMISDINFSPKFPELVLASYTNNVTAPHDPNGIVQVWNLHLHSRPEYVFHSMSDILTAKFSPFHPNLIVGGSYSGQVLLWDTRSSRAGGGAPVQKTPLTGSGHTHPVYNISIVGTQNAHNIITASTDGVVCGWTVDMLSQPQEYLELTTPPPSKTEDLAPTTMTFPQSDPTFFLVGTEEGAIYPCHRYDRAGAKAGTDHRLSYRGHAAPVMSTVFHPARGAVDLGDLMLSSSLDWSVKLWRVRPPAVTSTSGTSATTPAQVVSPVLELNREDVVYDARWSPHRPGVFALVDGAGSVEVWDLCTDTEVYAARATPTKARNAVIEQSLNKVAWEERDGRRLATGGLDGVLTVFEVGKDLSGGPDEVPAEEWSAMKKLVAKLEQGRD